ncbi:hypothetical protein CW745_08765 [Psychromonas sp. psych-6C06]|uniref:fibronectin type III domain-containing protein n=1 Tax=Psychromonas sp. psych-6C06 TaxID=2058089 RepID=UPI000C3461A9|nr:fibronectin type III domain-containing protein [Psychromonas sp. psych-6C06]PKF61419.1 hypothetical protein CW745_08765 [Psychromonas sp. psych-6C06]
MNQLFTYSKTYYFTLFIYLFFSPVVAAESLLVSWVDNSNEDVFFVEKRQPGDASFQRVAILSENTNSYTDIDVIIDKTYCYRIIAFNQAGQSISDEVCQEVQGVVSSPIPPTSPTSPTLPIHPDLVDPSGNMVVSHQFIPRPINIEIAEKKLYSFKSDELYNDRYSEDDIFNVDFYVNEGNLYRIDREDFSFQQDGVELDNGYASMVFDTSNSLSFVLQASGDLQVATLYMRAGVWSHEESSILVTVGDTIEKITLPSGYGWHYIMVDIEFDGTAPVTITTDSDRAVYSSVMFAGLVINNKPSAPQYAAMVDIDTNVDYKIDVSNVKFMVSNGEIGNEGASDVSITSLGYYGKTMVYDSPYEFVSANGGDYSGYRYMGWKESNGVDIKLQSAESQVNTTSLYFKVGVWSHEATFIELTINGVNELIEVPSGYRWYYMKIEVEFEGELELDLHPYGERGGYSALGFVGLTFE